MIGAAAIAMALTALVLVASGPADSQVSAVEAQWTNLADPQRVALAQTLMRGNSAIKRTIMTKLQEETPAEAPAEEAPAEEAPAEETPAEEESPSPLHEPGFVIATTDDSSPPPVIPLSQRRCLLRAEPMQGTWPMPKGGTVG